MAAEPRTAVSHCRVAAEPRALESHSCGSSCRTAYCCPAKPQCRNCVSSGRRGRDRFSTNSSCSRGKATRKRSLYSLELFPEAPAGPREFFLRHEFFFERGTTASVPRRRCLTRRRAKLCFACGPFHAQRPDCRYHTL